MIAIFTSIELCGWYSFELCEGNLRDCHTVRRVNNLPLLLNILEVIRRALFGHEQLFVIHKVRKEMVDLLILLVD